MTVSCSSFGSLFNLAGNTRAMKRFRCGTNDKTRCWTLGDELNDLESTLESFTNDTETGLYDKNDEWTTSNNGIVVPLSSLVARKDRKRKKRHTSASSKRYEKNFFRCVCYQCKLIDCLCFRSSLSDVDDRKKQVIFVDEPLYPVPHQSTDTFHDVSELPNLNAPVLRDYTEVLLSNSSAIETGDLKKEYGNDFVESFCTPRVFSINIESRLCNSGAAGHRCHLIFALRASVGDDSSCYRLVRDGQQKVQPKSYSCHYYDDFCN